jgi:hypothetical protein
MVYHGSVLEMTAFPPKNRVQRFPNNSSTWKAAVMSGRNKAFTAAAITAGYFFHMH